MPFSRGLALCCIAFFAACASSAEPGSDELGPSPEPGKEDGAGRPGLPVVGDYADTEVWKVENQWEDRDTPQAKLPGMAWGASSGLTWDEKFSRWVGSFDKTIAESGYGETILISTPFGKSVPGPRVDCADLAIILRVSFSAWYKLPFSMTAGTTPQIFFGHFGIRTATGAWAQAPRFAQTNHDYSSMAPADYQKAWPKDASVRKMHVMEDVITFLEPGAGVGAVVDELHLNKRAARLIVLMQNYLGSANVVDTNNTYNLQPIALRTGDTLMFRRGTRGSGHTMVIVRADKNADGTIEAQDVYGNEPPAQPYFESPQWTKNNFMSDEGGGPSTNSDGEIYSHIGGGLKRWRVAKNKSGVWTNTWMNADEASWIDSTDYEHIAARPAQFGKILGEPSPEEKLSGLLEQLEIKRRYLREHPASCAAREGREIVLRELASVLYNETSQSFDAKYRKLEDYVFAPLDYQKSKTCCWNSSTANMGEIILAYAEEEQQTKCIAPTVFKMEDGGYAKYAAYAQKIGRAAEWRPWKADEECVATGNTDTLSPIPASTDWCMLPEIRNLRADTDGGDTSGVDGGTP